MSEENETKPFKIADATLYIGLGTALVYMWAYARELGSKSFYKLPNMFIEINTEMVVKSLADTWTHLMLGLIVLWFSSYIKRESDGFKVIFAAIVVMGCILILTNDSDMLYVYSWISGFILIFDFFKNHMSKLIYGAVLIFLFTLLAVGIGKTQAQNETGYLVYERVDPKSKKVSQYVIIDTYSNYFVIAPLKPNSSEMMATFELLDQKSLAQQKEKMQFKEIGPLKIVSK